MKTKQSVKKTLMAVIIATLAAFAGVANATPTQWTRTVLHPAWDQEYVLDLTTLLPGYLPGADSLSSAFFSLDFSNNGSSNKGTASFEVFVNETITGLVTFTKDLHDSLPLPASTLADLSANGKIDFLFHKTGGNSSFDLDEATFIVNGSHSTQAEPVPEPATMVLLGAGFLCLAVYGKRRRNA